VAAIDECGFDPDQWNPPDLQSTLRIIHIWLEWLVEGAPDDVLADLRPEIETVLSVHRDSGTYEGDLAELHTAMHALDHAGRIRHRHTEPQTGSVLQVNASGGGVPKKAIDGPARIEWNGLTTDAQNDRANHGRPWQAVCLWSADVIGALVAEGHPIGPGYAGENLTVRGLDWSAVSPGLRIRVGTALLETTPYSIPCSKNAQWFLDGDFRRMTHDLYPGVSRIYARVLEPGDVQAGDVVEVIP
jgi:MOSC domain-containing protein YiiM